MKPKPRGIESDWELLENEVDDWDVQYEGKNRRRNKWKKHYVSLKEMKY